MAISQRSNFAWFDVEFTEGEEPEITDDKTNSSITEWLVTEFLSCRVLESPVQGMLVRSEKLSQILLDDDLVNHAHDDMATAEEVLQRASEIAVGKRRR